MGEYRTYDPATDVGAVQRMWREVGWIDDSDRQADAVEQLFSVGSAMVATIAGEAECAVHRTPGALRYGDTDLALSAVTAVTTSHVARKQGFASRLMTDAVASAAHEGAAVAGLGMFEQGFYDRFGFGTLTYEHRLSFDPSSLTVDVPDRPPVRVTPGDAGDLHSLLLRRTRGHGSVVFDPPEQMQAELGFIDKPFGLGFRAGDGRLTHAVVGSMGGEHGPYSIDWMAYETTDQLLELLGVLRGLGDQLGTVTVTEPAEIQLQDVIDRPLRQAGYVGLVGGRSVPHSAVAWVQARILDLAACVAARTWVGPPFDFVLRLQDPVAGHPPVGERPSWPGIGGSYVVHVGRCSSAAPGDDPALPVLQASVNAFTRMWLGARPASSLALTDDLDGPPQLVQQLDEAFRLPPPRPGWNF